MEVQVAEGDCLTVQIVCQGFLVAEIGGLGKDLIIAESDISR
jgi:hypothetical protein